MASRALVIKTYGDAETANAIAEGIVRIHPVTARDTERLKRECMRLKLEAADMKYAPKPVHPVRDKLLGIWGLLWLIIRAVRL